MSRSCTSSADHLDLATSFPAGPPLTLAAWVKRNAIGVAHQAVNLGLTGDFNNRYSISASAADAVNANEKDTVSSGALSTVLINDTNWHLWTGVFVSHSSRSAFADGGGKNTVSGARTGPNTPTVIRLGGDPSGANGLNGLIAHVAIWDIDLSDSEVLQLLTSDPRLIQPTHLLHYWPLTGNQSPEPDLGQRGEPLIVTNTTYSATDPPALLGVQEAGLLATIIRGVAG